MSEHPSEPKYADKAFYVTTPIYYVTAAPSIGSAYTTVAADVIARWHRQRGEAAWFLTGTDEHGQKVMQAAEQHDTDPREWTTRLVESEWKPVLDVIDASNDDFIRTTDHRHTERVQEFWQRLYDAGEVYQGEYEGPYCVACEEFKLDSELIEGEDGVKLCPIHERPVDIVSESNYFFPLSKYADRLLELYDANPTFVQPESARNEVISFVKQNLTDLSISRSTFDWGIRVPWDDKQVLYVWIDALLNYVTAIGYGDDDGQFERTWPADVQLVGRDILRFHAVIWPAMLMAAGLPVPRQVFAHGWLLVGGQKMSKSKATAIHPSEIIDTFGSDAYRYYFMKTIAFGSDGSFSWEHMSAVYESELANGLGNLASRVTSMVGRYFDGVLPGPGEASPAERALADALGDAAKTADEAMDRLAIHESLRAVEGFVSAVNLYVTEQEPWKVAKDDAARERLGTILYTAAESLRALAVLYAPVMPKTSRALWDSLGAAERLGGLEAQDVRDAGRWGQLPPGATVTKGASLFPRVEQADA
ncbi:methionine--tRNA ligase [Solicola gregarius]|uniref:Methionine--tRNA ligase n=1 Tax=Solicola gregarius TaxID=2908642 RepID=A0AA46YLG4_9ACTN|nr:methionine--tRNA ligase [Solicola gregarius]UYM06597.1 methionine--tRNA ligase [Solicola gregarius]